jgi:hypothetical protein
MHTLARACEELTEKNNNNSNSNSNICELVVLALHRNANCHVDGVYFFFVGATNLEPVPLADRARATPPRAAGRSVGLTPNNNII